MTSRSTLRRLADEKAATLVEFALILPVLLLLVVGIIEFGRVYNAQISLTGAAREGARVMAVQNNWSAAEAATVNAAGIPPDSVTRAPAACTPGATMTVTATRSVAINVPFWAAPSFDLQGVGVMRCGG